MSSPIQPFSERAFYLTEFRRRSIGIAWPADEPFESEPLASVITELVENQTRVVVLSPCETVLEAVASQPPVDLSLTDFAPRLWRQLQVLGRAGLRVSDQAFESECERAALRLRLAKLVWIQSLPPVVRTGENEMADGAPESRVSMVDLAHLASLLGEAPPGSEDPPLCARPGRLPLLAAIRSMIAGGVPAVNVCAAKELAQELFTYSGAGTFFARDRYAEVRALALDDFDAASDLIARGEADGYLVARDAQARDGILAHGVGVFIEGRYLAGIGAILPHRPENAAEIASLYALTRYVGEGVGGQIVRYAIDRARVDGLDYLFSCTTSERVQWFFERNGFRVVSQDDVPPRKWQGYGDERRQRVRCLRLDLDA
jgi:N-acetylglutamate synthase-like GNAT family acetyltransferase